MDAELGGLFEECLCYQAAGFEMVHVMMVHVRGEDLPDVTIALTLTLALTLALTLDRHPLNAKPVAASQKLQPVAFTSRRTRPTTALPQAHESDTTYL